MGVSLRVCAFGAQGQVGPGQSLSCALLCVGCVGWEHSSWPEPASASSILVTFISSEL